MTTYQLSSDIEYWGDDVTQQVADRAAEIAQADIEDAFDVDVEIVSGDAHHDPNDETTQTVFDYVQKNWVRWLSQADDELAP